MIDSISLNETNRATYLPEDNKLRLYIGRVPRAEYLKLRAEGWTALHKQREAGGGDFVATWTPSRRDTALAYSGGVIDDEDMSPAERAADRAERFAGYREKRLGEATGHADRFDAGPSAHGFQDYGRAVRSADRHDRIAGRAVDAWCKAEYWQRRTAGVIGHALYKLSPAVRMGRIKEIEKELRKHEANTAAAVARFEKWKAISEMTDPAAQTVAAKALAGGSDDYWSRYFHPRPESVGDYARKNGTSLWDLLSQDVDPITGAEAAALYLAGRSMPEADNDWSTHYKLRLAYETQMIEGAGGLAGSLEMEAGGFVGKYQIRKVNRSAASGRIVSVSIMAPTGANYDRKGKAYGPDNPRPMTIHNLEVERMGQEVYRPPTDEERAAFDAMVREEKAKRKAAAIPCPLINPTAEDAARLVAIWNATRREEYERRVIPGLRKFDEFKPCEVREMPQAFYSEHAQGAHARAETKGICGLGRIDDRNKWHDYSGTSRREAPKGPTICKVRTTGFDPLHLIVIKDKPRKPFPPAVWEAYAPKVEAMELALA